MEMIFSDSLNNSTHIKKALENSSAFYLYLVLKEEFNTECHK